MYDSLDCNDFLFQTPLWCCEYMVSLLPAGCVDILESTPGCGNLVSVLVRNGYRVTAPRCFQDLERRRFDAVVMNPPFNKGVEYQFLYDCMSMSDIVIALMPFNTIISSDSRTDYLLKWGIRSVVRLPRSTFPRIRTQVCILEMIKGYSKPIELRLSASILHQNVLFVV